MVTIIGGITKGVCCYSYTSILLYVSDTVLSEFLLRLISDLIKDIPTLAPDYILEVKLVSLPVQAPAPVVEWINRYSSYDKVLIIIAGIDD
ncbi:unnamed protein product [Macrosiphum euphorbiae]|uniref:Uncharacterized protein n=1 Tax=Macrosiphum euphorbiae TaxID=13131 RepID=A0AAV0VNS8_9HEMI|nr:unnamed protein product [Macrosiphum euphorbiae]